MIKRILFAAVLSFACWALTTYWYKSTGLGSLRDSSQKPIAFVERTKDEILRRPVTRVIWQLITDGEPLFPGEAIRTSSEGEARIQFADSKRFIDLEPDSLIVISRGSDNEIALDLMDGGLQVNQGGGGGNDGPALTLKSGNSKVDLSKATASLSKSSNGRIDLQVLRGKANIENQGNLKTNDQDQIKILSPVLGQVFYFDPGAPLPVQFSWKGFPAGSLVSLETGSLRKNMKERAQTAEEKLSVKLPPGKHYWKLVAHDPQTKAVTMESAVFRIEVASRFAPELLSPAADEQIAQAAAAQSVELRWSRPASSKDIQLEVASDDQFKNKVLAQNFGKEDRMRRPFNEGDYYVRLSAHMEDSDQVLMGRVVRFHVSGKVKLPPVIVTWTDPQPDQNTPQYFLEQPQVKLGWTADQKDRVKSWRVKVAPNELDLSTAKAISFETNQNNGKFDVPKAGRYSATVEALNDKHQVIASAPPRPLDVQLMPLLPAPHLDGQDAGLDADPRGRLDLKWNAVEGAKEYLVTLYDKDGKEVHTGRFQKNSTALQNLLPGEMQVGVVAVDAHGRPGTKEPPRKVRVPASSGLGAPKVKRIKVD